MGLIDSPKHDKFPYQIPHLKLLDYHDQNIMFKTSLFLNEIFSLTIYLTKISFITIILLKNKIEIFFLLHVKKQNSIYVSVMHTWIYFKTLLNKTKNVLLKTHLTFSQVSYTSIGNDIHNLIKSFHENHDLPIWILFVTSLEVHIIISTYLLLVNNHQHVCSRLNVIIFI